MTYQVLIGICHVLRRDKSFTSCRFNLIISGNPSLGYKFFGVTTLVDLSYIRNKLCTKSFFNAIAACQRN